MLPAEDRCFMKAVCIDKRCQTVFYTPLTESVIECYQCGQTFSKDSLQELQEVPPQEIKGAVQNFICRMIINRTYPKRGTEMVKVLGLSNYFCKLLSPFLTKYGMDKATGRAKLLTEMNQGEIFDCSLFGDRAFLIEPEHISIPGFGKDITGSLDYLSETLKLIVASNGGEERLIPIHADGDGHCLVHAISRSLVGRELFWHPLRSCLKRHFEENLEKYKELFKDFIDSVEWESIIEECDPNFQPPEGELHGLRNIHIFGLANVLRRPIILLDSLECMKKCGDYSALFLPGFVSPDDCRGKDKSLNKPLCIAWSSYSHNHYIPLVGVQKRPLPVLPLTLIPKVWGMPQSQISFYMDFDSSGNCVIGGSRVLSDAYIQRLVHAMEVLFYETNGIHPTLVADAKLFLFPDNILFSAKPSMVIEKVKAVHHHSQLYRCLFCKALCEVQVEDNSLGNRSAMCNQIRQSSKRVLSDFKNQGIYSNYDALPGNRSELLTCSFCAYPNVLRKVTNDGTVIYKAEDKDCLDKALLHFDQAKKFFPDENLGPHYMKDFKPNKMSVKLLWNEKQVEEQISAIDFQHKSKESMDIFIEELVNKLIEKHFSDDSSNPKLKAYISGEIMKQLKKSGINTDLELPSKKQELAKNEKADNPSSGTVQKKLPLSELQYIKVVTSDGQQSNLTLSEEGLAYGQLQEWIKNEFDIPIKNQRIKYGFPPKEIQPSGDTNKQILPLKHGDRLLVEIINKENITSVLNSFSSQRNITKEIALTNTWTKFQNDVLWNIVKASPENFRRNGSIYKQIEENNLLHSTMHANLEGFTNKVFCYNHLTDSIDLCVKNVGHFLISSDVDLRIDQVRNGECVLGFSKCPLMSKLEGMGDSRTHFRTASSSQSSEEAPKRPLVRKGPGFSVLTKPPDDMDIS